MNRPLPNLTSLQVFCLCFCIQNFLNNSLSCSNRHWCKDNSGIFGIQVCLYYRFYTYVTIKTC